MNTSALLLTSITMLLLTSCGGGTTTVAEGGIGGTGISAGKVSGYGSIFVNGVEFQTDTADFVIEEDTDSLYSQEDIKLGMVVQVTYDDSGNATRVDYSDQLEGIINSKNLDADGIGTLEIMRQTVQVDQTTVFDDATGQSLLITDLAADDVVEVIGYSDGRGEIYATRVELKSHSWTSGGDLEVKGLISNLTSTTFNIGDLVIDHSNAVLDFYNLENDLYVEVKGDSFSATGQFEADVIELEGDGNLQIAPDDTEVELEGVVTSALMDDQFSLNGQPVSIANLTLPPAEVDKLVIGGELKVEGIMVDGVILATGIEFEASESELQEIGSTLEVNPTVEDINTGSILLLGQSIAITSSTIMEDDRDDDDQLFNLASLNAGDYIEVDVYQGSTGLVAVKLEREDDRVTDKIEGVVEAVNVGSDPDLILVMGILIDLSNPNIPPTEYPTEGERVEVSGNYDDTILWAESLDIED